MGEKKRSKDPKEPGDPFDMTEVWNEFKVRVQVAKKLAAKDIDGSGFVSIHEAETAVTEDTSQQQDGGHIATEDWVEQEDEKSQKLGVDAQLSVLLKELDMDVTYEHIFASADFDFKTLQSMAQADASCCTSELKEAGVLT